MLFNCLRHNCSTSVQYSYYICIQHMQYMFTKFLWNMCITETYNAIRGLCNWMVLRIRIPEMNHLPCKEERQLLLKLPHNPS